MLKFCYLGGYDRIFNSGLEGNIVKVKLGVGVLIEPPLKSSPKDKMLTSFK